MQLGVNGYCNINISTYKLKCLTYKMLTHELLHSLKD